MRQSVTAKHASEGDSANGPKRRQRDGLAAAVRVSVYTTCAS